MSNLEKHTYTHARTGCCRVSKPNTEQGDRRGGEKMSSVVSGECCLESQPCCTQASRPLQRAGTVPASTPAPSLGMPLLFFRPSPLRLSPSCLYASSLVSLSLASSLCVRLYNVMYDCLPRRRHTNCCEEREREREKDIGLSLSLALRVYISKHA